MTGANTLYGDGLHQLAIAVNDHVPESAVIIVRRKADMTAYLLDPRRMAADRIRLSEIDLARFHVAVLEGLEQQAASQQCQRADIGCKELARGEARA